VQENIPRHSAIGPFLNTCTVNFLLFNSFEKKLKAEYSMMIEDFCDFYKIKMNWEHVYTSNEIFENFQKL
jgi:hypothetical protein